MSWFSRRRADVSAKLAAEYSQVLVSSDNQAIIDGSDTVVLAIRPQIAELVIHSLKVRDGEKVISVVAATSAATGPRTLPANLLGQGMLDRKEAVFLGHPALRRYIGVASRIVSNDDHHEPARTPAWLSSSLVADFTVR